MHGFLSQHWVQKALGVPVNYTFGSAAVAEGFDSVGDFGRPGSREAVSYLLDSGVKVALVYGDRDFVCNWIGGERTSLAIDYSAFQLFRDAGYASIITSDDKSWGGMVRQHGNFSFSRVFQAGHEGMPCTSVPSLNADLIILVPSYQPAVAYDIFMRAMFNFDIATGFHPVTDDYSSQGPEDTWFIKNYPPERPEPVCYILSTETCTEEQYEMVKNGSGIVRDYILLEDEDDGVSRNFVDEVQHWQKVLNEEL